MAGGTFTTYNKNRPGAYINIKAEPRQSIGMGKRGIVTFPAVLPWGAECGVIEITSKELYDGTALKKIGLSAFDDDAVLFRETFKNAHTALVYRVNPGGVKATAQIAPNLSAIAAYSGEFGNEITVAVRSSEGFEEIKFTVSTFVKGKSVDEQIVTAATDFKPNGWIEISGEGNIEVTTAGISLKGGKNGTTSDDTYCNDYSKAISAYKWNVMFIPTESVTVTKKMTEFIKDLRENKGKKVQAVLYNCDADYEGIINVKNGYKTDTEAIAPVAFTAYMAGVSAGAEIAQSNTYHVIPGAIDIVDPLTDEEIEETLTTGLLVLSRRQDGAIVIEKDINSLHTYGDDKNHDFSKNMIIRTLDDIANEATALYETKYIGKVGNTENGRNVFKADLIGYFNQLQELGAIEDFDSANDIEVLPGTDRESIIVNVAIKVTDAMEKLYMSVTVS